MSALVKEVWPVCQSQQRRRDLCVSPRKGGVACVIISVGVEC